MSAELRRILEPESVAIVGASKDPTKRGYQIIEVLQDGGYTGSIYPVNPKYPDSEILGRTVHETVSAIPEQVDVAYIVTPAAIVPDIIRDCGTAGVAGAIIMAAGFSEEGNADLESEVVRLAHEHGMRVVGPNINGMFNTALNLDLVGIGIPNIPTGTVSLLSQSGNFASSVIHEANTEHRIGFDQYVGIGNEADIQFGEYLEFLAQKERTDAILMYIEGLSNGEQFIKQASQITPTMPIVALKGGTSPAGRQSAASHTASIAGNSDVVQDVFTQAGIVTVDRWDEVLPIVESLNELPAADGPNIGIITDGGGHATHAADALSKAGLSVPTLEPETQDAIQERVPEVGNSANPIDLISLEGDIERLADCAELMLADGTLDALLVCGFYGGYGDRFADELSDAEVAVGHRLEDLTAQYETPIIVQSVYGNTDIETIHQLKALDIPLTESINQAVSCIDALVRYGDHLATHDRKSDFRTAPGSTTPSLPPSAGSLSEIEAKTLLEEYELPIQKWDVAESADEAVAIARRFDEPVAMKIVSADIPHKSDAGGVELDVEGTEAVWRSYEAILERVKEQRPDASIDGVLLSPMVEKGVELIVGMTRDEEVGRVIMFGVGGVFVEVLEDVAFRGIPLTEFDAQSLINELQAKPLLDGIRGQEGVDEDAIVSLLQTVSQIASENPRIEEFELNPVIARGDRLSIVDASMTLSAPDVE